MAGRILRNGKPVWPSWDYRSTAMDSVQAQLIESLRNIAAEQLLETKALRGELQAALGVLRRIDRRLAAKLPAVAGRPKRAR